MPKMPGICKTIDVTVRCESGFDQRTIQSSDQHGYGVGQQSDHPLGYQPSPGCEPEPGKRSVVGNLWQRDRFGTGIPVWKSSYLPKSKQLNNDINVQFDFSIRKNNTIIRRITENVDQLTAGKK